MGYLFNFIAYSYLPLVRTSTNLFGCAPAHAFLLGCTYRVLTDVCLLLQTEVEFNIEEGCLDLKIMAYYEKKINSDRPAEEHVSLFPHSSSSWSEF